MSDFADEIDAVHRETGQRHIPAGAGRTVVMRRSYDAPVEDVWDAITDPDRINRWFLPITGDLRLGGRYQLKGNAGGEILRCEPPHLLAVTWVFGEDTTDADITEVQVRLSPGADGATVFELEHTAVVDPQRWAEFGPGAVGVGWDLTLIGLGLHLRGESIDDPDAWLVSPEVREYMTASSDAWGLALRAAGATPAEVAAAVGNTTRFYAPDPDAAEEWGRRRCVAASSIRPQARARPAEHHPAGRRPSGGLGVEDRAGDEPLVCRNELVFADPAVAEVQDAPGVAGDVRLVGDEDHGHALLAVEALEDGHDLFARAGVQRAGRLVGQDDGRVVDQRAGDGHALLLAAGELGRPVVVRARRGRPPPARRGPSPCDPADAGVEQGQLHLLEGAGAGQQVELLEDEADLLVAHRRPARRRRARLVSTPSSQYVPAVGWSRQPRTFIRVDLPEPDGPMMAISSPRRDLEARRRPARAPSWSPMV